MSRMRGMACAMVLLGAPAMAWASGGACHVDAAAMTSTRSAWLSPVAAELSSNATQLGGASGVLAQSFDEALSVDSVLLRIRIDGCRAVASITPPAPNAATDTIDPSGYKPATAYDNRPWRFNMTQNGKRMTADEFDAWMKARGVRVVGRKDPAQPAATAPATPAPATPASAPAPAPSTPAK